MSKGKVLYITYDGMTDPLGQSQVIPYLSILAKQGYEITLLSTEKPDRYKKGKELIQTILNQASIQWEPVMFHTRPPLLSKLYDQYLLNSTARKLYLREKFDFIHVRSYVPAAAALKLKKEFGVPFLFDMRGFWVDERVDNGQWNLTNPFFRLLYKLYKKKEQVYLKEAKKIIILTRKGKEELKRFANVADDRIEVIPCCADLDHFDYNKITAIQREEIKRELHVNPGAKVLSYLGSLGGWYLTDAMLDFYKLMLNQKPDTIFLFITHNSEKEVLQKAAEKGIRSDNIRVKAAARNEVPLLLSISDWSIFFIKDAYSKKASSPTKQGEIMAMGIPVICNDIGDTGIIVEESKAGVVIRDFTEEQYRHAIRQMEDLADSPRQKIRESSFVYYNLEHGGEMYLSIYHEFINGNNKKFSV